MDFTELYADSVSSVAVAARSGCRRRLRRLMKRGFSVDRRDNRGWNALHEAAAAGSTECVQEILSAAAGAGSSRGRAADVNSLTHEGESAAHLAAQRGHLAALRLLLEANANVNQLTNDLSCPLYAAVDGGHREVVELLLSKGAAANRTHTASCWTCLHQAVYKGHSDIVRVLVDVCDLEALDDHKISPLFVAAQYGQQECLEILVGANVSAQAADLASPLLIASQEGHGACVDFLLDHGADPNLDCSLEWPQLPIHAAAEFGHIGVLRRLIAVTDRACDRAEDMVSPLYLAVVSRQSRSVEMLLREGYSPDAQVCSHLQGVKSPLSLALSLTSNEPCSESVGLLVTAGARLGEEDWIHAIATDKTDLLTLILEHRWIPRQETLTRDGFVQNRNGKTFLTQQELRELLCVALNQVRFAACWLPLLLNAGLEPSLLLQPQMLQRADSEVLNYLLEFVNWSILSPPLKHILDQRRAAKTWEPRPHLDSIPLLSHLCRMQVRSVLGPDQLMRTDVVQQLPVPSPLHVFLRFRDIPQAIYTPSPPSPPL
ncbi:ankyrin repeat and SOCS box protein 3 isoform X7 [Gasterosteus aculeatus]